MRPLVVLGAALLLMVAGCGGDDAGGLELDPGDGPLIYVVLGNSMTFMPTGSGAMDHYRDMLADDFDVPVEFHDRTSGGMRGDVLLQRLREDDYLRADLTEAHVVTLVVPFDEWRVPAQVATGFEGRDPADCGGADHLDCLRAVADDWAVTVEAIFAELTALVDPNRTVIRVQGSHFPYVSLMQASGAWDVLGPFWRDAQSRAADVAASYGIPTAEVDREFTGSDGTDDPEERGLIGADREHPSEDGARLIAEMLHDFGYDPLGSG